MMGWRGEKHLPGQYQNLGYFRVLGILFTRSATTSMTVAPNPTGRMTYT